ncbi:MAG: Na(+)/H(+) antiporter subunit A [Myxococcales bacterium]
MLWAVLSGFGLALVAPWVQRALGRYAAPCLALLPLALGVIFVLHASDLASGSVRETWDWVPGLGIQMSFSLDGLSLLMCLAVCGIGALVFIYAGSYLEGHPDLGRFWVSLSAFMASMLGVVLADDVIALFVFWELTSVTSYMLIGFGHDREGARKAALQALLVTGAGGLALLAGLLLLGHVGGSWALSTLTERGDVVRAHGAYVGILALVAAGAFTKSAQFPFHFWLPSAMEAPAPVSAYLHSATMVKAGVYLLARLHPALSGTPEWTALVGGTGALTMVVGMVLALRQTDMKLILAYTTVSALGTLTLLLGLGTDAAITAAVALLLAHSLYKGALFLFAGAVDHATGSRDVTALGGLRAVMPVLALAGALAALSMAGLPPLFGFVAKEAVLEAGLGVAWAAPVVGAAVLAGALLVAAAGMVAVDPLVGPVGPTAHTHAPGWGLTLGPALLAALGLLLGLAPGLTDALLGAAAGAVRGSPQPVELHLWHGLTPALAISGVTLALGALAYAGRARLRAWLAAADGLLSRGPAAWYDGALAGLVAVAGAQTRFLQSGYLRTYQLTLVGTTVLLAGGTWLVTDGALAIGPLEDVRVHEAIIAGLVLAAAVLAVRTESRLGAVAALGVAGYGVALVYVLFGAPDLAITQILVETLAVVLFVFVFYRLPRLLHRSSWGVQVRDLVVAGSFGALMTLLILAANDARLFPHISEHVLESSVPEGHGRNVVNVILVDFRAIDTLGEVVVLTLAAIGVVALMKLYPRSSESP